jgi:putative intracellular protease/amidase
MKPAFSVGVVLFDGFELLDVFGPLEMFGMFPDTFELNLVAEKDRLIASAQGPRCAADEIFGDRQYDLLVVPGGRGTRTEIDNEVVLGWLKAQSENAQYITSVCTGSALLAKAGILDGIRATSNKMSFDWVAAQGPNVRWVREARWVEDGNVFTSSGVSAGMDMALAVIEHVLGRKAADQAADWAEYIRNRDADLDPFA